MVYRKRWIEEKRTCYRIVEIKRPYSDLFSKHLAYISSCDLITGQDMNKNLCFTVGKKNGFAIVKLSRALRLATGSIALSSSDFFELLADKTLLEDVRSKDKPILRCFLEENRITRLCLVGYMKLKERRCPRFLARKV